jgi:hypothetical protein
MPARTMFKSVDDASQQMLTTFDSSRVIAIFPKGAFPMFSLIIFLPCPSCYKLKGFWDCISTSIIEEEKVYVV